MTPTLYSRPLSRTARATLVDFVTSYIESLHAQAVDGRAEVAKQKALACLQTDIDILVFIVTIATMHSDQGRALLLTTFHDLMLPREAADAIVGIMETAIAIDKSKRPT